jgi:hypothetical protein
LREDTRVLCASGSLGLTPFHDESFEAGLARRPHAIAADAGSGDIGPFYLGSGHRYATADWERWDLARMLRGAREVGAKVIVGSAGGAGLDEAVDLYRDLVVEIARSDGLGALRVACIYSEVGSDWLRERLDRIVPLGAPWEATEAVVAETARAVVMIGVEPYLRALDEGVDVIIAGRSCDDAVFAALPMWMGHDKALSLHMGKTVECGPACATPILGREAILGTVRDLDFLVEPLHPGQRCTPASVASHTLYERTDPYHQAGPGGELNLEQVGFEPVTDRVVRVTGSRWREDSAYRLKIEGSGRVGSRKLVLFGLRDPIAIRQRESLFAAIRSEVEHVLGADGWQLHFSTYGVDAILGDRETIGTPPHEVAVLVQAIADTEEQARKAAELVKYGSLRAHYDGKLASAGGAALAGDEILSPEHDAYRWTLDHLVEVDDPFQACRIEYGEV